MIMKRERDYEKVMDATEAFLPYINNWATCDLFCPENFWQTSTAVISKNSAMAGLGQNVYRSVRDRHADAILFRRTFYA